ncbi:uncharacterized protein [Battus philenor]|uniref:uncharacterized protein n=1 Tax=Battus philenor TaxID=42288 RepID=UPI0035CF04A6
MLKLFLFYFSVTLFGFCEAVSTKVDLNEEQISTSEDTYSSKENEDVEVKHTIVVSTKLKNNNRRASQNSRDDSGHPITLKREDSGEVPVIKGYKAVETTKILTPDTRRKLPVNSANSFPRRNTPDEYDIYPNIGFNPTQFKPSSFYNNINRWNQENARNFDNFIRRNDRSGYVNAQSSGFLRGFSDDSAKDFYCKKCRELNGGYMRGCELPGRNNLRRHETTTPKIKIDGKLVKLK